MKVYQFLPSLAYGDATGNDAVALKKLLISFGYKTEIYAQNIDRRFPLGTAKVFEFLPKIHTEDIIIYHFSIGSFISDLIKSFSCRKILIYHNITPPIFMEQFNEELAHACASGLSQIASLNHEFDFAIADSEFNKNCLLEMGFSCPIKVLPILIPFDDYKIKPCKDTISQYQDDKTNILFVGRIAPNKKHENIIRAFDCYKKNINKNSRLIFVGNSSGMELYKTCLDKYISSLGLENDIVFTGHIRFNQILSFYRTADVFLCLSEHEGFCVPLVEAMLFDIPIIAYASCAVPETLGNQGIILNDNSPELVAAAIDRVVSDKTLQKKIIESQRIRLGEFSYERTGKLFENYMTQFLNCTD